MKRFALAFGGIAALTLAAGTASAQCSYTCDGDKNTVAKAAEKSSVQAASLQTADGNIVEVALGAGNFKTLAAALKAAGLVEALQGKGPFTVFAPTDEAFAKLPPGTVENLLKPENKTTLQTILKYHVVPAQVVAKDVKAGPAPTLSDQRIDIKISGGNVMVDNAKVVKTDVMATNGVIHVIDSVILPNDKDIVGTAVAAGNFTTLARLLEQAELVGALQGKGPFTVFAPTDEAFAKLPQETVASLLKPENRDQLAAILTYHVIPGRVYSDAAAKGATVKTLNGAEVTTKSDYGSVKVNNAKVVAADIDATNGVIHVNDTVILAPAK